MANYSHHMPHHHMCQEQQSQSDAIDPDHDPVIQYVWGTVALVTIAFWSSFIYLIAG